MSLYGAITNIQAIAGGLPDVKDAPVDPPETAIVFPFAVCYPVRGEWQRITDWRRAIHELYVEFHCSNALLPAAIAKAITYVELFPRALISDPTLGGEVATLMISDDRPMIYQFGRMEWNSTETIGVRFTVALKLNEAIT